jgi:predicted methyltransferase
MTPTARFAGFFLAAAVTAGGVALAQSPSVKVPAYVTAALADPGRADQANDDDRRKAAIVVAYSGAKPGDSVIDFLPGTGYWSKIFAGVVGPKGHVYALWPAFLGSHAKAVPDLNALAQQPHYKAIHAEVQSTDLPVATTPVDLFWTVQNYHDIPNPAEFDAAVLKTLKPGGIYLVIDHAAAAGNGLGDTKTLHRIDPQVVKAQVTAAGFQFVGSLDVLANPADDHKLRVFDPAIRGHTDQFVFKFRKPK